MKRIRIYPTLKTWRLTLALSQREAADLLGVSQSLYARLELGRRTRPHQAKAISTKTGVSFERLMGVA
jgi:transcriptional regulator with XRE-family HTH domain